MFGSGRREMARAQPSQCLGGSTDYEEHFVSRVLGELNRNVSMARFDDKALFECRVVVILTAAGKFFFNAPS